jgi:hypothetical protein
MKVLTRGEKAAQTRAANLAAVAAAERHERFRLRALKAWETRRRNLRKAGRLTRSGKPTQAEQANRTAQALRAWETRRAA